MYIYLLSAPIWFSKLPILKDYLDPMVLDYLVWPLVQIGLLLFVVLTLIAYLTLAERKISAWIQVRIGPNRVGPQGLLQPLADGIKLLIKEDLIPLKADKGIFIVAPIIAMVAALVSLAVIPWGAAWATISNIDVGLLFILAVSSFGVLGIILGGWASNSKYALLGALRSAAQMVSYEVPMGLALIGALMFTKTLALQDMVINQENLHIWNVLFQPLGFLIYLISGIAETNRAPFDLPEAESELVAGYHTEYSGFRFSLFFIAEYASMLIISAIAVTVFLGGWYLPGLSYILIPGSTLFVLASIGVFAFKTLVLLYVFFWLRWSLPRYRYDQLMELAWKWMIPASLANILLTATILVIAKEFGLIESQGNFLSISTAGYIFLIGTAFIITVPLTWIILGQINARSRDFNLREVEPLPMNRAKKNS
ncbi:MAG: NADH-quinone oxidoreductase subunit NuoH [Acidobacteria bacterium]|nr:NADH-quinone oxidoreductase subunit NuoH [Acidobacteriota bacterium]